MLNFKKVKRLSTQQNTRQYDSVIQLSSLMAYDMDSELIKDEDRKDGILLSESDSDIMEEYQFNKQNQQSIQHFSQEQQGEVDEQVSKQQKEDNYHNVDNNPQKKNLTDESNLKYLKVFQKQTILFMKSSQYQYQKHNQTLDLVSHRERIQQNLIIRESQCNGQSTDLTTSIMTKEYKKKYIAKWNQQEKQSRKIFNETRIKTKNLNRKTRKTITKQTLSQILTYFQQYQHPHPMYNGQSLTLRVISKLLDLAESTIIHKHDQYKKTGTITGGTLIKCRDIKRNYSKSILLEKYIRTVLSMKKRMSPQMISAYIQRQFKFKTNANKVRRVMREMKIKQMKAVQQQQMIKQFKQMNKHRKLNPNSSNNSSKNFVNLIDQPIIILDQPIIPKQKPIKQNQTSSIFINDNYDCDSNSHDARFTYSFDIE